MPAVNYLILKEKKTDNDLRNIKVLMMGTEFSRITEKIPVFFSS